MLSCALKARSKQSFVEFCRRRRRRRCYNNNYNNNTQKTRERQQRAMLLLLLSVCACESNCNWSQTKATMLSTLTLAAAVAWSPALDDFAAKAIKPTQQQQQSKLSSARALFCARAAKSQLPTFCFFFFFSVCFFSWLANNNESHTHDEQCAVEWRM